MSGRDMKVIKDKQLAALKADIIKPTRPLKPEAEQLFYEVVHAHPASFFEPQHAPMLEAYASHVTTAAQLSAVIDIIDISKILDDPLSVNYLNTLSVMRDRENKGAMSIATKLRITKQALRHEVAARDKKNCITAGARSERKTPWSK